MKYRLLFAVAAFFLTLSCVCPAARTGEPVNTEKKAFIGNAAVLIADTPGSIKAGGEFAVVLEENASTGYSWTYTMVPEGLATETGKQSFGTSEKPMMGAPVTTVWKFRADAEGVLTLTYLYYRPWEKPESAVKRVTYTVTIVK